MKEKTADELFKELGYEPIDLTDIVGKPWGIKYQNEKKRCWN